MRGIGISLAGPVNQGDATLLNPPNLPGLNSYSPKPILQERFRVPVLVGNDANLGAFGEYRYGVARNVSNFVYVTIGTGIGGGIIINGNLLIGARGYAGEIGHMTIRPGGVRCNCGKLGCLEALASGAALRKLALERLPMKSDSHLNMIYQSAPNDLTGEKIMEAAQNGDELAKELVRHFSDNLGIGLGNLMNIFDSDLIILGGGVSKSAQVYMDSLLESTAENLMAHLKETLSITISSLGDDAGGEENRVPHIRCCRRPSCPSIADGGRYPAFQGEMGGEIR